MQKQFAFIACLIAASFFCLLSPAHAHGDHKEQPASPEPAHSPDATENIYSAEDKTSSPDADLPLSRMDMAPDEHMEHKEMQTGHDEHAGHKMPQVKMATHERVSTSQKGYGLAAGITILAGLVFCALSIIRPNE